MRCYNILVNKFTSYSTFERLVDHMKRTIAFYSPETGYLPSMPILTSEEFQSAKLKYICTSWNADPKANVHVYKQLDSSDEYVGVEEADIDEAIAAINILLS